MCFAVFIVSVKEYSKVESYNILENVTILNMEKIKDELFEVQATVSIKDVKEVANIKEIEEEDKDYAK